MAPSKSQELSYSQIVAQVLQQSREPLTVDELIPLVENIRPIITRNPKATIRSALKEMYRVVSLGGRPARYAWWPNLLHHNVFRQPLTQARLKTGDVPLLMEVLVVMGPGLSNRSRAEKELLITVSLDDGTQFSAPIERLTKITDGWGFQQNAVLARWFQKHEATHQDELLITVDDVEERSFTFQFQRRSDRLEEEIKLRNEELLEQAEKVLRFSQGGVLSSEFVPRLVVRDVFRNPVPPEPIDDVLRLDMRFLYSHHVYILTERHINYLERKPMVGPGPVQAPKPRGDRNKARTAKDRQKWAEYLFDQGMEYLWVGLDYHGEAYHREAVRLDPLHADAWVHVGNRLYDNDCYPEALYCYQRGQEAAEARTIGIPEEYEHPFWLDIDTRPFMRALHGQGLCLWRMERTEEAKAIFERMMRLNPNDNQGVRFLLHDLEEGLTLEVSIAKDEGLLTYGDV